MNSPELDGSIDHLAAQPAAPRFRLSRLTITVCVLILASFICGAAALSDVAANLGDIVKMAAVLTFIGAMVALALNMVGDAYRS